MKKIVAFLLLSLMLLQVMPTVSAETYIPSRVINLVYDDSSSMLMGGRDTWCQAKYAMEVFAAMLGERDTLNIYYMSYYSGTPEDPGCPPKLTLKGSKDPSVTASNVAKIHNLVTYSYGTPFRAVQQAYSDLKQDSADEMWLVVLTDGAFEDGYMQSSEVEGYFDDWASESDISIMMLSMGADAAEITPNPAKRIYGEKADNSTDILGKLTGICNRIFQQNQLPLDKSNLSATFNVPMSQLTVFAQGKEVSIGAIKNNNGEEITANSNVQVQYSTEATLNPDYPPSVIHVADNLMGYVATFDADFEPGTYTFQVTGAEDIQVYYKPNVAIEAYLYGAETEVTGEELLVAGTYRLEFGFVNAVTGEKITDTSLLGDVTYQADIVNTTKDGEKIELTAKSGDSITIQEGTLEIDVEARFLEYNTVKTGLSFEVFDSKELVFTFEEKPTYHLNKEGFTDDDQPMVLTVAIKHAGKTEALTPEQLGLLGIPKVTTEDDLGAFRVEESGEPGKFYVYPTLKDDDPMATATGTIGIKVAGEFQEGESAAVGRKSDTFEIKDEISAWDRIKDFWEKYWPQIIISLILLILLLGYIPPFKKYLPRRIKKRPLIECSAEKIGMRDTVSHGKFKRNLSSTLIPYKAETGFVTFSPSPHKKTARLRAAGGNGMYVTNTKNFAGKDEFSFNGMSIEEGRTKPYRISGGSTISLKTPEYLYTCYLNR